MFFLFHFKVGAGSIFHFSRLSVPCYTPLVIVNDFAVFRSIVMVIGPTPPGTGVLALAIFLRFKLAASKQTLSNQR
jgi:hypothetical protein